MSGAKFIELFAQLAREYEEWNSSERDDGLIISTDCLDDFIDWAAKKITDKGLESTTNIDGE